MMRIVIVEDEIRIREGIIKLIKKVNAKHEIVGEAENGIDGLRLIEETKPDLIITDIKMSDMDGLEMLARLKELHISVKAIVLSAYSEFSYAQQAIKLGVSEYLLKPISVGNLTQSLQNIEIQIVQESNYRKDRLEVLQSLETVFHSILLGGMSVDAELIEFLTRSYRLSANSDFIFIPVYLGNNYDQNYGRMGKELHLILKKKKGLEYRLLEIPQNKILLLIIYSYTNEHDLERWFQHSVLAQLRREKICRACFGWISFCGISNMKNSLYTLLQNMDWNIVLGDDVIVSYPKVTQILTIPLSYPLDIESQMRVALCAMDSKKLEGTMQNFCQYFKSGSLYSPKEIKESYVRFIWSIINVTKEINFDQYKLIQQHEFLQNIMTATTNAELELTLQDLISFLRKGIIGDSSVNLTVQRAKSMVHEFYDQGITLDEIALKLNITPEYLGTQFHKEVGVNFSSYIKDYRIKKAKELIIGTQLKLYEVADKVGYSDSKYFSQVFKECTGQLPTEYRKRNK